MTNILKGRVIIHNDKTELTELGRFYAISEIENIEETLDIIKTNGIETPLSIEPPHLLDNIIEQIQFCLSEMSYTSTILDYIDSIKNERDFIAYECEYLKNKLNINNPKKEHFYKMIKKLYSIEPNSLTCSICMDIIETDDLQITNCGHIFCNQCFIKGQQITDNCAVCRSKCYGMYE